MENYISFYLRHSETNDVLEANNKQSINTKFFLAQCNLPQFVYVFISGKNVLSVYFTSMEVTYFLSPYINLMLSSIKNILLLPLRRIILFVCFLLLLFCFIFVFQDKKCIFGCRKEVLLLMLLFLI